jgi:ankyrin repeat protein
MAKEPKQPKKLMALTEKLRKAFSEVKDNPAEMAAFLTEHHIDANAQTHKVGTRYNRYLFFNTFQDLPIECFQYFIENGVDLSLTYDGDTLLHTYRARNDKAKLEMILKAGANTNAQDSNGNVPINELVRRYGDGKTEQKRNEAGEWVQMPKNFDHHLSFIQLLLAHGANPTIPNNYGECAIDWLQERKNEGFDDVDNKRLADLLAEYGF